MVEFKKKKVDEDWKRQAAREREKIAEETKQEEPRSQGPTFEHLIFILVNQALLQLGDIENPITGYKNVDLVGAKFSIDMIQVLAEKTRGNLTPEEESRLAEVLYDLERRFAMKAGAVL